jgi:uridine kinase
MDILDTRKLYTPKLHSKTAEFFEDSVQSMGKDQKVFIVGICGGQGGGKTKLSKVLSKNIPRSAIIEERNFFKAQTTKRKLSFGDEPLAGEFGGYSKNRKLLLVELSNPKSYNYDKLYETLKQLIEGKAVFIRKFNEEEGVYTNEEIEINPNEITLVIVEGYFILKDKKIRDLINLKIYSEIDDDIRLSRLLINENKFLNNNPVAFKNFFLIYEKFIKYSYEQNIAPTKQYAKIILPNYTVNEDQTIEGDETLSLLITNLQNVAKRRRCIDK